MKMSAPPPPPLVTVRITRDEIDTLNEIRADMHLSDVRELQTELAHLVDAHFDRGSAEFADRAREVLRRIDEVRGRGFNRLVPIAEEL